MNDTIMNIIQLGFSSYEAKAYYALLQKHPAIGYEISKRARIPSAKVYEVLQSLKNKGAVMASSSEPNLYSPLPPRALLSQIRTGVNGLIDTLEKSLAQVQPLPDTDMVWKVSNYKCFAGKMQEMMEQAKQSLLISLWPEEAEMVMPQLENAMDRGVRIYGGIFGESSLDCKNVINLEPCGKTSHMRLGKRLTVIVADDRQVLIGEIGGDVLADGVWTTTPAIILVAKEYIKHDIWGRMLVDEIGEERFAALCADNDMLSWLIKNR